MRKAYSGRTLQAIRAAVWNAHPHVCHLCGHPIESYAQYEPDHLLPRSTGHPPLDVANMRPAHGTRSRERCNQRRGDKTVSEYEATRTVDNTSLFGGCVT